MLSMDTRRPPSPDDKYYAHAHTHTPNPNGTQRQYQSARQPQRQRLFLLLERRQHNGTSNGAPPARIPCINCGTLETPLWRRTPDGSPICNACGLYQKSRNMPRPPSLSPSTHSTQGQGATHPAANPSSHPSHSYAQGANGAAPTGAERAQAHGGVGGGTCPGDGRCDGTGGTSACSGCPTWNNSGARLSLSPTPLRRTFLPPTTPITTFRIRIRVKGAGAHAPNGHLSGPAQGGQGQNGFTNGGGQGNGGGGGDEPASMRQILNPTPPPVGAGSPAGSFHHGSPPPTTSAPAAPTSASAPPAAAQENNANGPNSASQTANGGSIPSTQGAGKINALACGNCGTSTTPLWRRDDVGNNICNACEHRRDWEPRNGIWDVEVR
ncbi:hypothetical protein DFH06DRAFT_187053 [Mycena polygramma]|nr:hypothetical protein DFH06DRAFT_187053 [Mycena polygramma]